MKSDASEVSASNETPVHETESLSEEVQETTPASATGSTLIAECDRCGHINPDGSRYCNRCGTRLVSSGSLDSADAGMAVASKGADRKGAQSFKAPPEQVPAKEASEFGSAVASGLTATGPGGSRGSSAPTATDAQGTVGRQVMIVVSAALLLVVALYVVTSMSGGSGGSFDLAPSAASQVAESPPLASQWQDREAILKASIEAATTEAEEVDARRSLINLYFAADRLDFAAEETVLIASITNLESDWIASGNLYFDWMQRAVDGQKTPWARKAIESYQQALLLVPDDLDVRTDMAIAYLYDPENAMMAIQETNKVLESDSLHIQANFNRGIMLTQINRMDQALEQFEKVMRIVGDSEDPVYQRASDAILRLKGQ